MKKINSKTKYALFFDVDGTLMIGDRISDENVNAINYAKNKGHYVFINSGRGMFNLNVEEIKKIEWDGYLSGSTYLTFRGKTLFSQFICKEAIRDLIDFCKWINVCCVLEGFSSNYAINSSATESTITIPGYVSEIIQTYPRIDDEQALNEVYEDIKASKITFMTVVNDELLKDNKYFDFIQFKDYTEGLQKGFNKAVLMKKIGDYLNIKQQEMIAFGDSLNDLQMLEYAGIKVVINGAPQKLLEIADIVTKSKITGVAEAIKILLN